MTDSFRELSSISNPDPGWETQWIFDPQTNDYRPIRVDDIYQMLCKLELNKNVPVQVRTHFDTTRNLVLYAWFVRRFIPVADWHACASLELALKIKAEGKIQYLHNLIRHAINEGWIKNEGFSKWREVKEGFERQLEIHRQLHEHMGRPFGPPNGGKFEWDYMSLLLEDIPYLRNEYAHGSTMLYPGTINLKVVAEFINQLFPDSDNAKEEHT